MIAPPSIEDSGSFGAEIPQPGEAGRALKVLDLFSGIGGFSLGLERATLPGAEINGFETVAFCEIESFPRKVLAKHWPDVPCYDDVRTLTAERLAADGIAVDVICGGFPCQDASIARCQWGERAGIDGLRTGLFSEIKRLSVELGCQLVLLENVPGLLSAGFGQVLGELAEIGFDAEWRCIRASDVGHEHQRDRLWIVAYASGEGWARPIADRGVFEPIEARIALACDETSRGGRPLVENLDGIRADDGLPLGLERARVKVCGNAVVPQIPELIGNAILQNLNTLRGINGSYTLEGMAHAENRLAGQSLHDTRGDFANRNAPALSGSFTFHNGDNTRV